ncbi:MAG: hypothetical protein J6W12_05315 [Bacteroidales bacterium]|nr:hypothetical protein [Bacteroidales bacterium]
MFGRILGIIISIGIIIAGLSGNFVLIGTESSIALVVVGVIFLIIDIIQIVRYNKQQETANGDKPVVAEIKDKENVKNTSVKPETQPKVQTNHHTQIETKYYFKNIFGTDFSRFEVRENVAVTDIAGYANEKFQLYKTRPYQAYKAEWGNPYTFGLYQNDEVKALIMIGDGRKMCKNVKYLISKMYAKKCDIPYVTFWTEAPNEKDYVIMRVNKYLNNNI